MVVGGWGVFVCLCCFSRRSSSRFRLLSSLGRGLPGFVCFVASRRRPGLFLFVVLLLSCRLSVVLGRWRPNWARPARGTRLPGAWESPPGAGEHGLALEGTG